MANDTEIAHHLMVVELATGDKRWRQAQPHGFVANATATVDVGGGVGGGGRGPWAIAAEAGDRMRTRISNTSLASSYTDAAVDGGGAVSVALEIAPPAAGGPAAGPVPEAPNGQWFDPGSKVWSLQYFAHVAYPRRVVSGTVAVGGNARRVAGVMWEQRMWTSWELAATRLGRTTGAARRHGRGTAFVWHWFAIHFEGEHSEYSFQCVTGKFGPFRPVPCTGVLSNGTHSTPLPDLALAASSRPWTSPATNVTYHTVNRLESAAAGLNLTLATLALDNELPGPDFPYYEGVSDASGTLFGQPARGEGVTEKMLRWV